MKSLFLIFLFSLTLIGCGDEYKVKYTLSGTANNYDITYEAGSNGTAQESNVDNTWVYEFDAELDDFLYLSAQNQNDSGTVTATISVNGSTFKTTTSSGEYVISTVSGSAGEE